METQPLNDRSPAPIEHPPLMHNRSCLRRGCGFSIGCSLLFISTLAFLAWFFSNPSAESRATLPPSFPNSIPLYRFDERQGITYISGDNFNKRWYKDLTALKLIVGKILIDFHLFNPNELLVFNDQTLAYKNASLSWIKEFLKNKNIPQANTVTILWDYLNVPPQVVSKFYKQNFDTQEFFYVEMLTTDQTRIINFNKKTIEGKIIITPNLKNQNQTTHVELRIHYTP